jgi:hypothetical protein
MHIQTTIPNNITEIRAGASDQPVVESEPLAKDRIQSTLHFVGDTMTLGNRWNLKPYQLRRVGLAAFTAVALYPAVRGTEVVAQHIVHGYEYSADSAIPSSEAHIDPKKDKSEPIPLIGAFDFAEKVDPNHDPRNGVDQFMKQLHGQTPEPGDIVAIPRPDISK